jgi:hypothetical protein
MAYSYEAEKPELFTEDGQRMFLRVRDRVKQLLRDAGAFTCDKAMAAAGGGSSWTMLACVDRLEELGEIKCVRRYPDCSTQEQVYVRKE